MTTRINELTKLKVMNADFKRIMSTPFHKDEGPF